MHAVFILLSSLFAISKAIQMECGSGSNVLEVEENSIFTLKCSGYSGTAIWARRIPGYAEQNIGICNASSCQKDEELNIVLTYLSSGSSSITSPHSSRENGNVTYSCTANSITKTCVTNIFVKSSLSNASVFFNRADKWSLNGNINITRIYSSLGRYQCQWKSISYPFSENGRLLPSNLLLTPSPGDLQNKADRFGTCSFRDNVTNYSDNIYKFTVLVTPGDIPVNTDMIEIVRPLAPSTDCVTSNIPENSTLRCTCRTQQVGKPGGRLLWITGKDGILNQIINVGSYDVDTLQIGPQRLTRNDDGTQFQCIVDWATNVTGTLYTSNVNYKSYVSNLTLNGFQDVLTINESLGQVQLLCVARGRPTPEIRLIQEGQKELIRQTGGNMEKDQASLSYQVSSNCESTGRYNCETNNRIGEPGFARVRFYVQCSPRSVSNTNTAEIPSVNFKGSARNLSFDVISFPFPNQFSFTYIGITYYTTATHQPSRSDIFEISCLAGDVLLARAKCTLTVDKVNDGDQGYYEVIVMNSFGNTSFVFRLAINETEPSELQKDKSVTDEKTAIVAGVSVAATVIIISLVVATVFVKRRKRKHLDKDGTRESDRTQIATIDSNVSDPLSQLKDTEDNITRSYDSLCMQDIGITSPYDEINRNELCSQAVKNQGISPISGPNYENNCSMEHSA